MVNKKDEHDVQEDDLEITNEPTGPDEPELVEEEEHTGTKIKKLRTDLQAAQEEARNLREELQRQKADFLNARRRLEEDRVLDQKRMIEKHVEKLLPMCDSFHLAMLDKATWESTNPSWRKGIEGINQQLMNLLTQYGVTAYDPANEPFDPVRHEAMTSVPVTDPAQHHRVTQVLQLGYELKDGDATRIIRPARVIVGELEQTDQQ